MFLSIFFDSPFHVKIGQIEKTKGEYLVID